MKNHYLKESAAALEALRVADPVLYRSLTQYDRVVPDERHYGGSILIDGEEVAQTIMCCHCNCQFLNVRLPGKARGWCMRCNAPVCPNPACDECVPFMQMIENIEKGRPRGFTPVWESVPVDVLKELK